MSILGTFYRTTKPFDRCRGRGETERRRDGVTAGPLLAVTAGGDRAEGGGHMARSAGRPPPPPLHCGIDRWSRRCGGWAGPPATDGLSWGLRQLRRPAHAVGSCRLAPPTAHALPWSCPRPPPVLPRGIPTSHRAQGRVSGSAGGGAAVSADRTGAMTHCAVPPTRLQLCHRRGTSRTAASRAAAEASKWNCTPLMTRYAAPRMEDAHLRIMTHRGWDVRVCMLCAEAWECAMDWRSTSLHATPLSGSRY